MTIVEQTFDGFQWAEPPRKGGKFKVEIKGSELVVTGRYPQYKVQDAPSDLIRQFEKAPKATVPIGKERIGKQSPDVMFANAGSDEELIDFVRRFGPVVAKTASLSELKVPLTAISNLFTRTITATQDMNELRNEQRIFRAALHIVNLLHQDEKQFDVEASRDWLGQIAAGIAKWPVQWERERSERNSQPDWELTEKSLNLILHTITFAKMLPPAPLRDARIVICELVNCFRSKMFSSRRDLHRSIQFGIRPLLYSILRRQLVAPREFSVCANTQCRDFFNLERAGQRFCCAECSQKQRQRIYWKAKGKELREIRSRRKSKT